MILIVKNNGDASWTLSDVNPSIEVLASDEAELTDTIEWVDIASSEQLAADIANPALSIVVNNGSADLTTPQALRLIYGVSIPEKRTSSDVLRVAVEKSDSDFRTLYSPNWCDKTTWYEAGIRVAEELATDRGDDRVYSVEHSPIIDTYHGKITNEDFLLDDDGETYRVIVKVNGEIKEEQDPHYNTASPDVSEQFKGNYIVDYRNGTVKFHEALDSNYEVLISYDYVTSSLFTIKPLDGEILKLSSIEVQISKDVSLKDTLKFQSYGYASFFAPQLGLPEGTKIPLGQPFVFKTMGDYFNDTIKAYPSYPPLGGSNWRGMRDTMYIMDWDYLKSRVLKSSLGLEVRIFLEYDEEFEGTFGTATFYCGVEEE